MSYTIQDLRCLKCKQIKRENMPIYCSCAGDFQNLIPKDELLSLLTVTFRNIADMYEMKMLQELLSYFVKTLV